MYRLLIKSGIRVDYVSTQQPDKIFDYKALYLPYYNMLSPELSEKLSEYVRRGGHLILDEGFGLREMNTWMQPYDIDFSALKIRMKERRQRADRAFIKEKEIITAPFKTEYAVEGAEPVVTYSDGTVAFLSSAFGEGTVYLSTFGIGYTYREYNDEALASFVIDLLAKAGVTIDPSVDRARGIYVRTTKSEKYTNTFILNASDDAYTITLDKKPLSVGGNAEIKAGTITINPKSAGYYVAEN
jgi:beta-galactosidase GanA